MHTKTKSNTEPLQTMGGAQNNKYTTIEPRQQPKPPGGGVAFNAICYIPYTFVDSINVFDCHLSDVFIDYIEIIAKQSKTRATRNNLQLKK